MTRIKQLGFLLVFLLLASGILFNRVLIKEFILDWQKPELPEARGFEETRHPERSEAESRDPIATAPSVVDDTRSFDSVPLARDSAQDDGNSLPLEYNLAVPFQPQAPHANWAMPYQEACEEASLIMAANFFKLPGFQMRPEDMDAEILDLVLWEKDRFGYYEDTTAAEVATVAYEYFGLKAELDYDVSVDNIKKHISQNRLVLVPAAGKILPNPYFRNGGPLYHMLVIRGYTETQFITNDPGTKRGEAFVYKYQDLIDAIHDWPRAHGGFKDSVTDEEMRNGTPVLIVLDRRASL